MGRAQATYSRHVLKQITWCTRQSQYVWTFMSNLCSLKKNSACLFKSLPIGGCPSPSVTPTYPSHTHAFSCPAACRGLHFGVYGRVQWPNIVLVMRNGRKVVLKTKNYARAHREAALSAPLSRDGISDICGHVIREDLLQDHSPTPLPPSLSGAYNHNNMNSGEAAYNTCCYKA